MVEEIGLNKLAEESGYFVPASAYNRPLVPAATLVLDTDQVRWTVEVPAAILSRKREGYGGELPSFGEAREP